MLGGNIPIDANRIVDINLLEIGKQYIVKSSMYAMRPLETLYFVKKVGPILFFNKENTIPEPGSRPTLLMDSKMHFDIFSTPETGVPLKRSQTPLSPRPGGGTRRRKRNKRTRKLRTRSR